MKLLLCFALLWLDQVHTTPLTVNTSGLKVDGKCSIQSLLDSIAGLVDSISNLVDEIPQDLLEQPAPTPSQQLPSPTEELTTEPTTASKKLPSPTEELTTEPPTQLTIGDSQENAATSCQQIASLRPQAESGHYWIKGKSCPVHVHCVFGGAPCGEGVWMQVANVNMTQENSSCPIELEKVTSPKSLCRKRVYPGCASMEFSTHGVPFTNVCGKVIGIQYYSTDGFGPYYHNQGFTIDDGYVDGVSITHSSQPRQHIWTFASAMDEYPGNPRTQVCPCTNALQNVPFPGRIPQFIGNDFFCETGSRNAYTSRYYLEDPLWDGKGCGRYSTCCEGDKRRWFHKTLPHPVASDIEARVCTNELRSTENVLIEIIALYVQ